MKRRKNDWKAKNLCFPRNQPPTLPSHPNNHIHLFSSYKSESGRKLKKLHNGRLGRPVLVSLHNGRLRRLDSWKLSCNTFSAKLRTQNTRRWTKLDWLLIINIHCLLWTITFVALLNYEVQHRILKSWYCCSGTCCNCKMIL